MNLSNMTLSPTPGIQFQGKTIVKDARVWNECAQIARETAEACHVGVKVRRRENPHSYIEAEAGGRSVFNYTNRTTPTVTFITQEKEAEADKFIRQKLTSLGFAFTVKDT